MNIIFDSIATLAGAYFHLNPEETKIEATTKATYINKNVKILITIDDGKD